LSAYFFTPEHKKKFALWFTCLISRGIPIRPCTTNPFLQCKQTHSSMAHIVVCHWGRPVWGDGRLESVGSRVVPPPGTLLEAWWLHFVHLGYAVHELGFFSFWWHTPPTIWVSKSQDKWFRSWPPHRPIGWHSYTQPRSGVLHCMERDMSCIV